MQILKASESGSILTYAWVEESTKEVITTPVAEVLFDNIFADDYACYEIIASNIVPDTDGADFQMNLRTDAPADATGTYRHGGRYEQVAGSGGAHYNWANTTLIGNIGSGADEQMCLTMTLFPRGANWSNWSLHGLRRNNAGGRYMQIAGGHLENTAAMAGVRFSFDSGNIESGSISWRGIA